MSPLCSSGLVRAKVHPAHRQLRTFLLRLLLLATLTHLNVAPAADLTLLTWPTTHAAPPASLPLAAQQALPAFRTALDILPESLLVQMALSQPALLSLPPDAAAQMQPLVAKRYERIATDSVFKSAPSSLPYCFTATRPTTGRALLYRPTTTTAQSPVILFLHGYGGSFLWYHQYLAEIFPDHLILCPAYGISPANIPAAYLTESLTAAEKLLGHKLRPPTLIGLSAGAFGAARIYAADPRRYSRLILLAGYFPDNTLSNFSPSYPIHLLAGANETFVTDGTWSRTLQQLTQHRIPTHPHLVPSAGHFFLLTHPTESTGWLKAAQASQ